MTTCPSNNERAEFVGGPWDGRFATAEDGEPLPLEMVVPWRDGRHRYVLHREWYGGLDVVAVDYEYAGPFVVK